MAKRKKPPKQSGSEEAAEPRTQEKAELVPPPRRPPTAVGAGTPPPPSRRPRQTPSAPEPHRRPALFRALQALRAAVGAVLDLADAAADAVTKGLQARH
jgi:hypothetical protein